MSSMFGTCPSCGQSLAACLCREQPSLEVGTCEICGLNFLQCYCDDHTTCSELGRTLVDLHKQLYSIGDKLNVKIKLINNNSKIPTYATEGSAGMDLYSNTPYPVIFKPLERKLIPTGIAIELPENYEAQIRPRSGLSIKNGMTLINCIGTVDEDFCSEICVAMINLSTEEQTINYHDRIAQMIISPIQKVNLIEVDILSTTKRGFGSFGSTGV